MYFVLILWTRCCIFNSCLEIEYFILLLSSQSTLRKTNLLQTAPKWNWIKIFKRQVYAPKFCEWKRIHTEMVTYTWTNTCCTGATNGGSSEPKTQDRRQRKPWAYATWEVRYHKLELEKIFLISEFFIFQGCVEILNKINLSIEKIVLQFYYLFCDYMELIMITILILLHINTKIWSAIWYIANSSVVTPNALLILV